MQDEQQLATLRVPPHSQEIEQSLIGSVLISNQAFEEVAWLSPDAFYADGHRRLWRTIAAMLEAGKPADLVTICEELGADLEKVGGPAYIASLCQNSGSQAMVRRYAEVVRDKALLRLYAQRATEVAEKALAPLADPAVVSVEAADAFLAIDEQNDRAEPVDFGHAVVEAVEASDNPRLGLSTGYPELDRLLRGLMPGDLIIIAGRPSMGKTALAMNIAEHVALTDQVAVLELEMTRARVAGRSLRYHESRLGRRDAAVDHLSSMKLWIDDTAVLSIGQARVRLRKIQRRRGLKLIVVDYLQLLYAKGENRTQEVSAVSRGLKAIAKDLGVPVIAVSQLNRGVESRADARPTLGDLRESGQIEQDADIIAFVYRDEYYKPDTEWRGVAEVIVRKNRDGPIGTAYLQWVPEHTRFLPLDRPLPTNSPPEPKKNVFDFKTQAAGG